MSREILFINTGGTISMATKGDVNTPLVPTNNLQSVIESYPFLSDIIQNYTSINKSVDSSDMNYDIWCEILDIIKENYNKYKGFVIFHGTDTMAYTASYLSYALQNLNKPVILTGSQIPIKNMRSDGLQNLLTSVDIIHASYKNDPYKSEITEVCIFFRDELYRGNRSIKESATNYMAFRSPNYPPLAISGTKIKFSQDKLKENKNHTEESLEIEKNFNPNVITVELFPSFDPKILEYISLNKDIKGVIIKTFGAGNVPNSNEFLSSIDKLIENGKYILNVTQCVNGGVYNGMYDNSFELFKRDVINGYDMTFEAAVTKFMIALGKYDNYNDVKNYMETGISGEITN